MDNCVFCKIIEGEIEADKVLESENFIVIRDVDPKVKGHLLVIPKKHFETFLDIPSLMFNDFMDISKKAALFSIKENNAEGFNFVMNNFEAADQVVSHAHLHVLPRKKNDGFNIGL